MQEANSPQSTKGRGWPAERLQRIGKKAALSVLIGGLFVWLLAGHAPNRTAPPTQSGMRKDYLVPPRFDTLQADLRDTHVLYIDPLHLPPPVSAPLYVANLAEDCGGYLVSVRQVLCGRAHLFGNVAPIVHLPAAKLIVSLQVMSVQHDLHDINIDAHSKVYAKDDTGKELVGSYLSNFRFPGGIGALFELPAPSPSARLLTYFAGTLVLSSLSQEEKFAERYESHLYPTLSQLSPHPQPLPQPPPVQRVSFRISHVPLPIATHIYGLLSARLLPNDQLGRFGSLPNLLCLTRTQAAALRKLFPPFVPDPGPLHLPNHLILSPYTSGHFVAPVGGMNLSQLDCTLTPTLGRYGLMPTRLTIKLMRASDDRAPLVWQSRFDFWDHEPVIFIMPSQWSPAGERLAVWMELYLDMPPPLANPVPPGQCIHLTVPDGELGGGLTGRVLVEGAPLALGIAKIALTCVEGAVKGQEDEVWLPLDKDGRWFLQGLYPGRYEVHLLQAQPYLSPFSVSDGFQWADYVRLHNGIQKGAWQNAVQQPIKVVAGSMTALQDWNYLPVSRGSMPPGVVAQGKLNP
ncbi:hypothetical protein [Chthonomonas calidirosea]|uniref:hypothetical protein n=1 Tax=Chthonomonas calidirosea TaxID=454171 RepID=UPI0006ECA407|nr:hypothetical protein [Chthonomonas calidirosea]CEK12803.1 hypothetical protein CP488_00209 [Chthonomonas calidirosea]